MVCSLNIIHISICFRSDITELKQLLHKRVSSHIVSITNGQECVTRIRKDIEVTYDNFVKVAALTLEDDNFHSACRLIKEVALLYKQLDAQDRNEPSATLASSVLSKTVGNIGRPAYEIPADSLEFLIGSSFKVSSISKMLGVSESTVKRRMQEYNIRVSDTYSDISDQILYEKIGNILESYPNIGYRAVKSHLFAQGFRVQESRVREAVRYVDPQGTTFRRLYLRVTKRRAYSVPASQVNHLKYLF